MPGSPDHDIHSDAHRPLTPAWKIGLLLLAGLILFAADSDFKIHPQYIAIPLMIAIAFIPSSGAALSRALDRVRHPSSKIKWITAAVIFVLSARYFLLSASLAGRELYPMFHDESMYLLQAQLLSHGRLWMPQHELADFFDSFNVIVKPVYASTYFPGTALFYVPGVWLKLAPWSTSVLIAAMAVTMFYIVFTELLDGVAGLLAALLAVSLEQLRVLAVMTMSHPAMLLLLLLSAWSYLRWRRHGSIGWAFALGAFAGWSAITRPLDAVCLIVPLGVAMLWDLRKSTGRRAGITLASVLLAALPFLSLQLILDKGVTGHALLTPFTLYGRANFPGLSLGFHPYTEATESASPLPQLRDYYRLFLRNDLRNHGAESFLRTWILHRCEPTADAALPAHLLFVLLPLGLLGLRYPARTALACGAFILPLAYTFYPSYLKHYGLVAAPAFILLVLLAGEVLRKRFPATATALALSIAAIAIGSLPELHGARDHFIQTPYLSDVNEKLAHLEHKPAVVLFRYQSNTTDVHEEPVFNVDTAWPDDAPIIRAQDLGPQNHRIFQYYARRQPQRFFYRYDRATTELTPLGWAQDLAK
jgi:hypothetical protein